MAIIQLSLTGAESTRLALFAEKDIRFIAAKSLTQTAQAVQEGVREHIKKDFVLRKPNFPNSIKIRPATKQDLEAKVFTMAGFATLQQTGGKQAAKTGRLAVPQYRHLRDVKSGRKSNPAGSFLMNLKDGGVAIASRANNEFKILFYLKNIAYMPKRLNMLELGEQIAVRDFPMVFHKNLGSFET